MAKNESWFRRNRKDLMLALAAVTTVLVGVMGFHWTETAEKPFWYTFWMVAAILADLLWVVLWVIFWTRDKHRRV